MILPVDKRLKFGHEVESLPDLTQANEERIESSAATTYDLDWSKSVFVLTLTAASAISDINLPTGTNTKVIELIISGDFALTLPAYWTARPSNDTYLGTGENHLVVSCINGNTGVEKVIYSLENL